LSKSSSSWLDTISLTLLCTSSPTTPCFGTPISLENSTAQSWQLEDYSATRNYYGDEGTKHGQDGISKESILGGVCVEWMYKADVSSAMLCSTHQSIRIAIDSPVQNQNLRIHLRLLRRSRYYPTTIRVSGHRFLGNKITLRSKQK
jgi:hypothetical protein